MKTCTHCQKEKPTSDFYKSPEAKDGLFSYCKSCHRVRSNKWRVENKQRDLENQRRWSENNRDKLRRAYKRYREKIGSKTLALRRKEWADRERGIVVDCLLEKQGRLCAICRDGFGRNKPHIDHNHTNGEIRGLLCQRCNIGLSFIENRKGFSQLAHKYLADFPAKGEGLRKYWSGSINALDKTK